MDATIDRLGLYGRGGGRTGPVHADLSIGFLDVLLHRIRGGQSRFGLPRVVLGPIGRVPLLIITHTNRRSIATHGLSM